VLALLLALLYLLAAQPSPAQSASSSLTVSADDRLLLAVNPDSNSVTILHIPTKGKIVELPVGEDPRSVVVDDERGRAYVVSRGSSELAVVDLAKWAVTERRAVGYRPMALALAPDGKLLAVAETGDDAVRLLDGDTLATRAIIATADHPSGLAFTPDSRRLLVTHLLSGEVTVIGLTPTPAVVARISTWDNIAPAPGVLINRAGTRAYLPQTMAHGQGLNTQFDNSVFPKLSVLNLETLTHQLSEHISLPEKDTPVGLPWAALLARGGQELWVVHAASNDISVLDVSDPVRVRRTAHVPVQDNPRGIAATSDGRWIFVNNTLAGTVSFIDAASYTVVDSVPVTEIPLPPVLLNGKRLFHTSARRDVSQAAWMSCNTCHIEGEHDGRTWVLQYTGAVPPGAKPVIRRNTTGLLGMVETYPLRWSAEWNESADSEFSIRFEQFGPGLIAGAMNPTLGPPNQGRSYDLDCLAAFIDSLAAPVRKRVPTAAQLRGKAIFDSPRTQCAECHPAPVYTDLKVHDVGTADGEGEWFGPKIDTPTLRYLHHSAPYMHDGSAPGLREVLTSANRNDRHGVTSHLLPQEIEDLIAFLLVLPYE
jgi:DNA-binding beta-propeller fold protein YncE